jgi:hypothetical protein
MASPQPPSLSAIDLTNVLYLFFRLFPIILPSYFVLSSLFSMDMKGVIYLAGLMFSILLTIMTANGLSHFTFFNDLLDIPNRSQRCEIISLTGNGNLSPYVPLSQIVYSFTFCYLVFIIGTYHLWEQNIVAIIMFGSLILLDMGWNYKQPCNTPFGIAMAFVLGGGWGALWAYMIDQSKAVNLQYFNGLSNRTVCTRPSSQTFVCKNTRTQ